MSRYILALDQGTSSSRAIVVRPARRPVAAAQQEFPQILPAPGVVEHDPEAIWSSQLAVAREAMRRAGLRRPAIWRPSASPISARRRSSGIAQRGRPVANAIVWQSRVTAPECDRLKAEGLEPLFREKTGLVLDAYFSGTKIKHLLDADRVAAPPRRSGRSAVRHRRQLFDLAADRRQAARHRRQQRQPHAAVQYPHARLGRRTARSCWTFRGECCPRFARRAKCMARRRPNGSAAKCRSAAARRPTSGHVRPGVLRSPAAPRTPTAPVASC